MVIGDPCKDCKSHSGIEAEVKSVGDDVNGIKKDLGENVKIIASKLSTSWFTWVLALLTAIVGSIFGVLWSGQSKLESNIIQNHKEIMQSLSAINTNATVAAIRAEIIADRVENLERKLNEHMDGQDISRSQYERDRKKWESDRENYKKNLAK